MKEFEGYDTEEFYDFLVAQKDDEFELFLSKDGVMYFSSHNELAWEFAIAAYVGQRLSDISNSFSYSSAPIADRGEFSFIIRTDKIDKFAEILELISGGFGNLEISDPIILNSEVSAFIEETPHDKIVCQDLLDIFHEYFTEENDEG